MACSPVPKVGEQLLPLLPLFQRPWDGWPHIMSTLGADILSTLSKYIHKAHNAETLLCF